MIKQAFRIFIFLSINFGALAVGGSFTGTGVSSDWYQNLNKAPWTPPGWVFGMAWTTIMICYSIFWGIYWPTLVKYRFGILSFVFQIILNISWNPVFFYFHRIDLGLIVIAFLTVLLLFQILYFRSKTGLGTLLLYPYFVWLLIATSLNTFILTYN